MTATISIRVDDFRLIEDHPILAAAAKDGILSVEMEYDRDCAFCDASRPAMRQWARIATGLPLVYPPEYQTPTYYPRRGEVLKNIYMECRVCGADQGS